MGIAQPVNKILVRHFTDLQMMTTFFTGYMVASRIPTGIFEDFVDKFQSTFIECNIYYKIETIKPVDNSTFNDFKRDLCEVALETTDAYSEEYKDIKQMYSETMK